LDQLEQRHEAILSPVLFQAFIIPDSAEPRKWRATASWSWRSAKKTPTTLASAKCPTSWTTTTYSWRSIKRTASNWYTKWTAAFSETFNENATSYATTWGSWIATA